MTLSSAGFNVTNVSVHGLVPAGTLVFALEYEYVVPIKPLDGDNPIKTTSMHQKKFSMFSFRVAWLGTDTCLCLGRSSKAYM